jgi:hypothetical protein
MATPEFVFDQSLPDYFAHLSIRPAPYSIPSLALRSIEPPCLFPSSGSDTFPPYLSHPTVRRAGCGRAEGPPRFRHSGAPEPG